jgi:hypothetical protein
MEIYLVKSSNQDEWGNEYWENLQVFSDLDLAEKFAKKIEKLIEDSGDPEIEQVEIENFSLRTQEI